MTDTPPKIENTPGLAWRRTATGKWEGRWRARQDLIKKGYRPRLIRLYLGEWPTPADEQYIRTRCKRLQGEMLIWGRGGIPTMTTFNGTLASLIGCYQHDRDSSFHKLRYKSRVGYSYLCERIVRDRGDEKIAEVKARHILRWHEDWAKDGRIAMAHSLMTMLRTVVSFGATFLEDAECARLSMALKQMRFENAKPRDERLTSDQVIAIRSEARAKGHRSLALAQAFQFELMLRQKDVIGEWVPISEPGTSAVTSGNDKWLRGITWNEVDQNMILRHVTSKRQKLIEVDLRNAPMVMDELRATYGENLTRADLPASGPIVVYEKTGLPYRMLAFRYLWRDMADAVGVPKSVRNMDSRAGAITEATESGADLEFIKHAATHSDIGMTQRYARAAQDKTATVMRLRAEHRNKRSTD